MKKFTIREFYELISEPTKLSQKEVVVQHADLPEVDDELSFTLRLKLEDISSGWSKICRKGNETKEVLIRTPGLWVRPSKTTLHARFTGNWEANAGIDEVGDGFLLNKWYHIAYTLSDSEKRMDVYINGEWTGFYCIQKVKTQKILFNDGPLRIGGNLNGEIWYDSS